MQTILGSKLGVVGLLALAILPLGRIRGASLGPLPIETSCIVDGAPVVCEGVHNWANAGSGFASGGPFPHSIGVSVMANVGVGLKGNTSGSAEVDLTFWATTAGPVRQGLALLDIFLDGDGNFAGTKGSQHVSASLSSSLLSQNCEGLPFPAGMCTGHAEFTDPPLGLEGGRALPLFALGLPFRIRLRAGVEMESVEAGAATGWGNDASLSLTLWELDFDELGFPRLGDPVEILGPVAIPEPSQFGAVVIAISAGVLWNLRRRSTLP